MYGGSPGFLFLAADGELTVVDVGARTSERLEFPQLRPGDPPYRIVRRANRLALYGGDTYALDLDLRSPPEKLGQSWFPSSKPHRVWLARLDPESPETVRALENLREVTVEGRVTPFPRSYRSAGGGRWAPSTTPRAGQAASRSWARARAR